MQTFSANAKSCDSEFDYLVWVRLKGTSAQYAQTKLDECIRSGGRVEALAGESSPDPGAWPRVVTYPCPEAAQRMLENVTFFSWHYPTAMEQAKVYCAAQAAAQAAAANSSLSSQKWTCSGATFDTQAQAQAYCDQINAAQAAAAQAAACNTAPEKPILDVTWTLSGVSFKVKASTLGDKISYLNWSYNLFNSNSKAWESWSVWVRESPLAPFTQEFAPKSGYSRIAFSVYASNSCGNSEESREVTTNSGVLLAPLIVDQFITHPINTPEASTWISVFQFISSKNGLDLVVASSTPEVCTVVNDQIFFITAGSCKLTSKSTSNSNIQKPEDLISEILVSKNGAAQAAADAKTKAEAKAVADKASADKASADKASADKAAADKASADKAAADKAAADKAAADKAIADLLAQQKAIADLFAQQKAIVDLLSQQKAAASKKPTTITCVKGKVTKTVTAVNPKCPSGYKKK